MKRIILADTMGFCWGVRRTLDIVSDSHSDIEPIAMIGDVIHNPQVVRELEDRGVTSVPSIGEALARGYTRIGTTAHGAGPERSGEAIASGLDLIDTTCPLVTRVQRLAEKLVRQGYFLVIYGDRSHPEAQGIFGWADTKRALITMKLDELPWSTTRSSDADASKVPPRKVAILSQTTKNPDGFVEFSHGILDLVAPSGGEVRICNTICEPTVRRQEAMRELASKVEAIIVVGGRKSSNTSRLAEVGRKLGTPSFHVESSEEICDHWLDDVETVGVTAGASTPDSAIFSVIAALEDRGYIWTGSAGQVISAHSVPAF
jgi:4-hydroxy-3-methylbut-2-en-1-yl diphosphate reductase